MFLDDSGTFSGVFFRILIDRSLPQLAVSAATVGTVDGRTHEDHVATAFNVALRLLGA